VVYGLFVDYISLALLSDHGIQSLGPVIVVLPPIGKPCLFSRPVVQKSSKHFHLKIDLSMVLFILGDRALQVSSSPMFHCVGGCQSRQLDFHHDYDCRHRSGSGVFLSKCPQSKQRYPYILAYIE
jgi:hypothetical protein